MIVCRFKPKKASGVANIRSLFSNVQTGEESNNKTLHVTLPGCLHFKLADIIDMSHLEINEIILILKE